jgi:hypothetical protein
MRTLLNPAKGANISTVIDGKLYNFKVGELLVFEDLVAEEMLNRYGFLEEKEIKQEPIKEETVPVIPVEEPVVLVEPIPAPIGSVSVDVTVPISAPAIDPEKIEDVVFLCSECEFKAKNKTGLISHIRLMHKGGSFDKKIREDDGSLVPKEAVGESVITPEMAREKEREDLHEALASNGKRDKDGVEWTGNGLEDDSVEDEL